MPKKILVGVLDWGLGHATRSVPLINYLSQFQCQIFIAASGPQKKVLLEIFPDLEFLNPPPYSIRYSKNGKYLPLEIFLQLPRLYKVIRDEKGWVGAQHGKHQFDLIISDNRYGFYHKSVPSVFISHQLSPKSGWGNLADRMLRKIHYHFIKRFNRCWVPDAETGGGLAGELSHPATLPPNTRFIGPLSRLEKQTGIQKKQLLILISGPEPARTHFEEMLRGQLKGYQGSHVLVRGLPTSAEHQSPNEFNHVDAPTLARLMTESSLVICRSGYTTIMDLLKMGRKAFLIPTPGQTEQEYLAGYLDSQGIFPFAKQSSFNLTAAIAKAERYPYKTPDLDFESYKKEIEILITADIWNKD